MKPEVTITTLVNQDKYISYLYHRDKNGKEHTKTVESINDKRHTINAMNIMAILQALTEIIRPSRIKIRTDSQYIYSAFANQWIDRWQQSDWINAKGQQVANKELWQQLLSMLEQHEYSFVLEEKNG